MVPRFRALSEPKLAGLEPAALLAYVHTARDAGEEAEATTALQLLMWRHERLIRALAAAKVPAHRVEEVADFCLVECAAAIVRNPPDATNETHFRGWLSTVVRNQVATWWRRNRRHEDPWEPEEGWDWPVEDRGFAAVEYGDVVERQLAKLNPVHREVVELRVFQELPSREVAERTELTVVNIDKIASRFRQDCRADAD